MSEVTQEYDASFFLLPGSSRHKTPCTHCVCNVHGLCADIDCSCFCKELLMRKEARRVLRELAA
jgi:hypothetical protein